MLAVGRKRSSELWGERSTVSSWINDVPQVNASSAVKQEAGTDMTLKAWRELALREREKPTPVDGLTERYVVLFLKQGIKYWQAGEDGRQVVQQ
jgi:hypothetical protein